MNSLHVIICVRHYAGQKIVEVSVAQPKTCRHSTGGCVLHMHVSVCVTHYTGPTILASITLSLYLGPQSCLGVGTLPRQLIGHPWPSVPPQTAPLAYSGTGDGTPPGHTQFLRPRNL